MTINSDVSRRSWVGLSVSRRAGGTLGAAVVGLALVLSAPAFATTEIESAPDSQSKKIEEARKQVGPILKGLSTDIRLPDILSVLENNLAEVREIIREIETAPNVDDIIDDISDRFDTVASNFDNVAALAPDVMARREELLRDLNDIQREANFSAAETRQDIQDLQKKNRELGKDLQNKQLSATELQKTKTDIRANEAIIRALEAGVEVWNAFSEQHEGLIETSDKNSELLDGFLHTLVRNADVYRSYAEVLRLRKNLKAISEDLHVIEGIDETIDELEKSWDDFNNAIDKLRQGFGAETPAS